MSKVPTRNLDVGPSWPVVVLPTALIFIVLGYVLFFPREYVRCERGIECAPHSAWARGECRCAP